MNNLQLNNNNKEHGRCKLAENIDNINCEHCKHLSVQVCSSTVHSACTVHSTVHSACSNSLCVINDATQKKCTFIRSAKKCPYTVL